VPIAFGRGGVIVTPVSMEAPLQTLRGALAALRADEAAERVGRWRRDPSAASVGQVLDRHRWLSGRSALDLVGEVAERGDFEAGEHAATLAHLARIERDRVLAPLRTGLAALASRPADGWSDRARVGDLIRGVLFAERAASAPEARLVDLAERVAEKAPIRKAQRIQQVGHSDK